MITEIEIDGVGILRPMNAYQLHRAMRIKDRGNRAIALAAFGLGLSVQQFKKLPPEKQREIWDAHSRLIAPAAISTRREPSHQAPQPPKPYTRLSEAQKAHYGRQLIDMKASLPHGHFRRWVEDKSGITYSQAQRYMSAAKEAGATTVHQSAA
ncbi:DUF3102 domain-containing protein [Agrobacterium tumefaciens]|uniref:DUF3102 domain-containing protein n=1 Tax=Agrobacterium tumefaciens TaxID=358 RepID=UPI001572A052|nr:DUF3102 domain-containing protein [Agrobacterium tumefaciens]WHO22638.1 DUF3102 domain-containing protein [Agrobacterium tumefaciens]